jgi:hypothetical protein
MTTLNSYSLKHLNSSTRPYVYYLYCKPTREFYIGCRYAKGCNPKDFWTTYFTSSKRIHELLLKYGKHSFFHYCIGEFDTREETLKLEEKLIENFLKNQNCLNLCKSGVKFSGVLPGTPKSLEYRKKQSERLKNKKVSQKWKDSHSKSWRLITPEGEEIIVKNLQEWCKVNSSLNLFPQNLRDVAKGIYKQYKGYKCEYYNNLK